MSTAQHPDTFYTEDEATQISLARAERWGLLMMVNELHTIDTPKARKKCHTLWRRINTLNRDLYKLTGNAIYMPS